MILCLVVRKVFLAGAPSTVLRGVQLVVNLAVVVVLTAYTQVFGQGSSLIHRDRAEKLKSDGIQLVQLTSMVGDENRPRFSFNGRKVVFSGSQNGRSKIFVLDLSDKSIRQITTGLSSEWDPFWFPDNETIGFNSNRGLKPEIWQQKVEENDSWTRLFASDSISPFSGSISPNGEVLLFSGIIKGKTFQFVMDLKTKSLNRLTSEGDEWHGRWNNSGEEVIYYVGRTDSLIILNMETQKSRVVNKGPHGGWHPSFSKNSGMFAYISERSERWDLWCGEVDGPGSTQITEGGWNEFPYWSPVSNSIVFSRRNSYNQLFSVSVSDRETKQVTDVNYDMVDFRVGRKESKQLFGKRTFGDELWVKDRNKERQLTVNFPGHIRSPVWSPDEKQVLFVNQSFQPNTTDIQLVASKGGEVRRLTSTLSADFPVWILKDTIHFSSRVDNVFQIFKIPVIGGEPSQLTEGPGNKIVTDVSSDGKSLLYHSGYRIFTLDLGTKRSIELVAGEGASYSRDGKSIAFVSNRNEEKSSDLYVMDLQTKAVKRITNSLVNESWPRWSTDGRRLYYNSSIGDKDIWMAILPE